MKASAAPANHRARAVDRIVVPPVVLRQANHSHMSTCYQDGGERPWESARHPRQLGCQLPRVAGGGGPTGVSMTARRPVKKTPSKVPAPPIEATGAWSPWIWL